MSDAPEEYDVYIILLYTARAIVASTHAAA